MKIISNQKKINRNIKIAQYTGIAAMVILVAGFIASIRYQDEVLISLGALIAGFVLSQISIRMSHRFGRTARPDQVLSDALKGLDDRYSLYHYTAPCNHLLVGPAGVFVLLPFHNAGRILYNKKRKEWVRKGGSLFMKVFSMDTIGRPSYEIEIERSKIQKHLQKIADFDPPAVEGALVFYHDEVEVDAEDAPYPTMHALTLKKFIRKRAKSPQAISLIDVNTIQNSLPQEE